MEINAEACLNQKNNLNRLAESGVKLIKGGVNVTAPRFSIVVPTYKRGNAEGHRDLCIDPEN